MTMIKLASKESKARAIAICEKVKQSNPTDGKWYRMGDNIIGYIKQGQLHFKQANWLCKNADYHDLERPEELLDFKVQSTPKADQLTQTEDETTQKILGHVGEIAKLILHLIRKPNSSW